MPTMISRMHDAYQTMFSPMNLGVRAVVRAIFKFVCMPTQSRLPQWRAVVARVGCLAKRRHNVAADGADVPGAGGPAGCIGRGRLRAVPGVGPAGAFAQLRYRHSGGTAAAGRGRDCPARGPGRQLVPAHLQRHTAGRPDAHSLNRLAVSCAHIPSHANSVCLLHASSLCKPRMQTLCDAHLCTGNRTRRTGRPSLRRQCRTAPTTRAR